LGAFTASAAPDVANVSAVNSGRIPVRTGTSFIRPIDNRTVAIALVLPQGTHLASARAQRDKWWLYF
jgi:hypothetical protein